MLRYSLAAMVVLSLLVSSAWAKEAADLSGQYQCKGTSDQGAAYSGIVEIKKVRQGYQLTWVVGKTKYSGIGFVHDGHMSVAWTVKTPQGTAIGVVQYKLQKNGVLEGKWVDPGLNGIYDEVLVPIEKDRLI